MSALGVGAAGIYIVIALFLQFRTKKKGLLWVSFAAAVLGGCTLAASSAGRSISGTFSGDFAVLVCIVLLIAVVCDIADQKPEKLATFGALLIPSLAIGMGGAFGATLHELFRWIATFGGQFGSGMFGA